MERRVIRRDVGAPGAVAFFKAQRFEGAIARGRDAMGLARRHQRVEDFADGGNRNVQFPAEFAHIGDAERPQLATGDGDLTHLAKFKRAIGQIGVGDLLDHFTRFRTHDG